MIETQPRPHGTTVWYAVGLTFSVNVLSNYDRTLVSTLLGPIQTELGLSDTQAGLMAGLPYALGYIFAALPSARWGDRHGYVRVLAASLAVWSGGTAVCGLAAGFATLLLARIVVGAGDAGHVPTSNVLTAAYVSERRRGAAFSFMLLAAAMGATLALAVGGALADAIGWRRTFVWSGLPGIGVALATWLTLREPRWERPPPDNAATGGLGADLREIARRRALVSLMVGTAIVIFVSNGFQAWAPVFLSRHFGLTTGEAGKAFGPVVGLGSVLGMVVGGAVADRLRRRDARWPAWLFGYGLLASAALQIPLFFVSDPRWIVPLLLPAAVFGILWAGPIVVLVQDLAGVRLRATAFALFAIGVNVLGVGLGPLAAGALADVLAHWTGSPASALDGALLALALVGICGPLMVLASSRRIPGEIARASADNGVMAALTPDRI